MYCMKHLPLIFALLLASIAPAKALTHYEIGDHWGGYAVGENDPGWTVKVGDVCFANDPHQTSFHGLSWVSFRPCIVTKVLPHNKFEILLLSCTPELPIAFADEVAKIGDPDSAEIVGWWIVRRASEIKKANEAEPLIGVPDSFYKMDGKKFLEEYLRDHKLPTPTDTTATDPINS